MPEETSKAVSRRRFIMGVIAGGAAVSAAGYLFRASTHHGNAPLIGAGERLITLNVNGRQRRVDVARQETLAWTLRYKLGLTGAKLGCDAANAAPVRFSSTTCRIIPARSSPTPCAAARSRRSKVWRRPMERCIRCSRASWMSRDFSAPSACRASSCQPWGS